MIKAVFDTNIFLSALFWKGPPNELLEKAVEKRFVLCSSPQILEEVRKKLGERFKYPFEETDAFMQFLFNLSEIVYPQLALQAVKEDPSDNKIIECAVQCGANYIVSGDRHLLEMKRFESIEIVSPRKFLEICKMGQRKLS